MARSYRFFLRNKATSVHLPEGENILREAEEPEIFYQLTKVLRVKNADEVRFGGIQQTVSGFSLVEDSVENLAGVRCFFDFLYQIEEIRKKEIHLRFEKKIMNSNELGMALKVVLCLPNRPDKLEFIVQKSVELGVRNIFLVKSDFSQMKHDLRAERLQKIMMEAAEQSERAVVPSLHFEDQLDFSNPQNDLSRKHSSSQTPVLKNFLEKTATNSPQKLSTLWTAMERSNEKETLSLPSLLQKNKQLPELSLLIGPEGGFSPQEKELIQKLNITCFSLGRRILRMETAAIVAIGIVGQYLETKQNQDKK